jgi:hypothetical protein
MGKINLGKVIALDSKYRAYIFIFVLLVLFFIPTAALSDSKVPTPCKLLFKEKCPSDGVLRGVSEGVKGNVKESFGYNKMAPIVILVMIVIILKDFTIRKRPTKLKRRVKHTPM